jgi:hypothetical protein
VIGAPRPMAVAVEDPGRKARFEILRSDVERKILEPLRTHNWAANIEREVSEGEYFIIAAERAGVSYRIAVFYTSATANGAYKQAAGQVERIFFNGAPYMVESFAHGLDRPVEPIDAFPTLLLQWNAATADGKFAPVADPPLTALATRLPSCRKLACGGELPAARRATHDEVCRRTTRDRRHVVRRGIFSLLSRPVHEDSRFVNRVWI